MQGMYRIFEQNLQAAEHLGICPSFLRDRKPWPLDDRSGFGEAMLILSRSLQKGRNSEMHKQFDTVRKIHSLTSGMNSARPANGMDGVGFKGGSKLWALNKKGIDSATFVRFIKGCEKGMGRVIRQDMALSVPILLKILHNLDEELADRGTPPGRCREVIMLGACLVIGFCVTLRGNEIFLVESTNLCHYKDQGAKHEIPHVVIPMMGRFKGETGEHNVLRVLVIETRTSRIQIGKWVKRLIKLMELEKGMDLNHPGPAFCDSQGFVLLAYSVMNSWFHEELAKVQESHLDLIQREVDLAETYNSYRSLRRGATSRVSELNYTETLINLNNRWRKTQSKKGQGGLVKMSQLYVEISLVVKNLLQFSASL